MVYDMNTQLKIGQEGEAFLDQLFRGRYKIHKPTTRAIDRIFRCRRTGRVLTIEYKTDLAAAGTGNAFLEVVSVDTQEKPGWALTSPAHLLVYYVPGPMLIYVAPMQTVKQLVPLWRSRYPVAASQNKTYSSRGILVPLEELARVSSTILQVRVEPLRGDVNGMDRVSPEPVETSQDPRDRRSFVGRPA